MASKPKNQSLPGLERKKIAAIEKAAAEYVVLRDNRMKLLREEIVAKTKLAELMHDNGLLVYKCDEDDLLVELVPGKEKLKVKKSDDDDEDSED